MLPDGYGGLTYGQFRTRWDQAFPNHGGWLEIHPVDNIRRIRPRPARRRHVEVVSACCGVGDTYTVDVLIDPFKTEVSRIPGQTLQYIELVDNRFTRPRSVVRHDVAPDDANGDRLRVTVTVAGSQIVILPAYMGAGCFKAIYIVWFA